MLVEDLLELDEVVQRIGLVLFQSGFDAEVHLGVEVGEHVEQDLEHVVHHVLVLGKDFLEPDVLKPIVHFAKGDTGGLVSDLTASLKGRLPSSFLVILSFNNRTDLHGI